MVRISFAEKLQSESSVPSKTSDTDLIIPIGKKWWELRPDISTIKIKSSINSNETKLREEAETLLELDRKKYVNYKQTKDKSDYNWIISVIQNGTFVDRLSAHTLLIQDSPIHNFQSISKLIDIVNCKGIRECLMSMDNLKDLFLGDLLLRDRKLKPFSELIGYLPTKESPKRSQQLIVAYFEDKLLTMYRRFVEILENNSMESTDAVKSKSVNVMFDLLTERPEQEQFLLEKLVNKLGDPIPKRASHVSNLLSKLVNKKHHRMKEIVVKEVERVLFRPHISDKAQYYSLCFLNQIILVQTDKELANRLINIYFNFFDSLTKQGEIKNRMMNVLIIGVSRAFPYASLDSESLEKRLESFYKLIHMVDQNTSVQGMVLIFNVLDMKDTGLIADRFYILLYRSLLELDLDTCTKRTLYLNLLFKSMKRDPVPQRVKAFIKRLFQVALHSSAAVACSILIVISETLKLKTELKDTSNPAQVYQASDDEDEGEHYDDVKEDDADEEQQKQDKKSKSEVDKNKPQTSATWVHTKNLKKAKETKISNADYDPLARNPLYTNSERCPHWELCYLKDHFHPSANLFATKVLNGEAIKYDGDPLVDFTINHFMDRFVFRNPKQISREKVAQSSKNTIFARNSKTRETPIHKLHEKSKSKVPLEEQFIYDYLVQKNKESEPKEDDTESVASEDFEKLLTKFEPDLDADEDFMKLSRRERRREAKKDRKEGYNTDSDDEDGSEVMFSDDEDFDIDSDDDEYHEAFDDVDDDLADISDDGTFLSDEEEDNKKASKFNRRGRDKDLTKLFATADKFAHLLEGKESDEEKEGGSDDDDDSGDGKKRRKMIKKRGKKIVKKFKRRR